MASFDEIAEIVHQAYLQSQIGVIAPAWQNDNTAWMQQLGSKTRGAQGAQYVKAACLEEGFEVTVTQVPIRPGSKNTTSILKYEGLTCAVKYSSVTSKQPNFKFSQFYRDTFEFAICFGNRPHDKRLWVIPYDAVIQYATVQWDGDPTREVRWIKFPRIGEPEWLAPYGGTWLAGMELLYEHLWETLVS
jgi:hypothetical protein